MSPVSASLAATAAPTSVPAAVFSSKERVTVVGLNTGALLALVVPEPLGDQPESPSSLLARTCTW